MRNHFRITKPVTDPVMLEPWVDHFRAHGIRCFVVHRLYGFSLWRKGFEVEIGSFSLSELQRTKVRFGLGIERDLYFTPKPAKEVWDNLLAGKHV